MRTIKASHLRSVPSDDGSKHVVIETREHEEIEFEGCSDDEVQAKLHDFYAWAS